MKKQFLTIFASLSVCTPLLGADAPQAAAPKVTYQDHVLPIFRNSCLNCHNPDKKKGDLDLSTYTGASTGGGSGKAFEPGDPDSSKLFKAVSWAEEPNMPPKGDKLSEKDLKVIREWIAGGAPETSGSKVVINKPKANLAVVVSTAGKPEGPAAMPKGLPIEPMVTAKRPAALTALASSPWAPLIAVGGHKQIVLYHADTLELLGVLAYPEGDCYSLHFSRNGSLLLAGGGTGAKTGKVVAFDVVTGNRVTEVGDEFDAVLASDISPDQSQVALGTPLRTLKIYNTADGSQAHAIKKHTDWVQAIAYSPDGKYLASGDRAGGLWVWEAKTGREVYNCAGHKEGVTDACFRGDSQLLASASQDGTIKFWNMAEGNMIKTITAHSGGVLSVSFTHDGRIVSCGRDGQVKLWGPDGSALKSMEPFADLALKATFTHDGSRVVAGDYTGAIRVWSVADGKRAGELTATPPTVAQQLAGFDQRMKDLQTAADAAAKELKAAQDGATAAAKDLKAAEDAKAAAQKALEDATAKVGTVTADVTAKAKSAKDALPAKQQAADAATAERNKTKAALAAASEGLASVKGKLPAKKAAVDEAAASLAKYQARLEAKKDDKDLIAKVDEKKTLVAQATAALEEANKVVAAKEPEVKKLTEALAKAEVEAKSAADALAVAKGDAKGTAESAPQIAAAKQAIAKAKGDLDAAGKAVTAKAEANKAAGEKVAKAEANAKGAVAAVEGAKGQKARLEASAAQPRK